MKQLLIFAVILLSAHCLIAQNNIEGYEYWFNDDFENRVVTPVAPVNVLNLNLNVPSNDLSTGVHTFNFRSWDSEMLYSVVLSRFFFKTPPSTGGTDAEILSYQYWLDSDFENVVTVNTTAQALVSVDELIDADNLNVGVHTFTIRFRDNSGLWSSPLSRFFYKVPAQLATDPEILEYQYWLDNDYENAVTVNTPAQALVSIDELIEADNLNVGVHTFTIRFKDNSGLWSSPLSRFFYKVPAQLATDPEILEYQYWLDNDYENAVTLNTPAQALVSIDELIEADNLNVGVHTFTIRFKDNSGLWSSPLSQFFYKVPEAATDNQMVAYRYWFNEAFDAVVEVTLDEPVPQLDLIENLDLTGLPQGDYTIHFQFKDERDLWSSVTTDSITKLPLPQAFFEVSLNDNCDSTTVIFINNSVDANTYLWDFGDGDTSTVESPQHVFFGPAAYTVTLTVTDTVSGMESTTMTDVFIPGHTAAEIDVAECAEYTAPSGTVTWTESGVYTDTIPNSMGCDSVITVNLDILNTTASFDTTACFSYTAPDGVEYTESGMVTAIIDNSAGCDSIITIDLTVVDIDLNVVQDQTILTAQQDGATYQWVNCNNNFEPIEGATEAVYTAVANGEYAVEITVGECSAISDCYSVTNVGVSSHFFDELRLFPNPTRGDFTLSLGAMHPELFIEVSDSYGRVVDEMTFNQRDEIQWKLNGAPGVYFVRIYAGDYFAVIRVVKQ